MDLRCEACSGPAEENPRFIPTERAVFETAILPPDAPFIRIIEEGPAEIQPTKKPKGAQLRPMKDWTDEEMTILVRSVKANMGHMKTGNLF